MVFILSYEVQEVLPICRHSLGIDLVKIVGERER